MMLTCEVVASIGSTRNESASMRIIIIEEHLVSPWGGSLEARGIGLIRRIPSVVVSLKSVKEVHKVVNFICRLR